MYFSTFGVFIRQVEVDWREMCTKVAFSESLILPLNLFTQCY